MDRLTAVQQKPKAPLIEEFRSSALPPTLDANPQWELAQRVVAGPHFARSPLLSKFLLFVVAETLEGHAEEITEHQIGVQVFDRPPDYRTLEDNIVRNYARQLRKRLAEHFAEQGSLEPVRIDIPVGGYVPVFIPASGAHPPEPINAPINGPGQASPMHAAPGSLASPAQPADGALPAAGLAAEPASRWKRNLALLLLGAAYSAALVAVTWFGAAHFIPRTSRAVDQSVPEPAQALWTALFSGPANSYIVPSDAGFNLLEDLARRPVPLAEYIEGSYQGLPLAGVDAHSASDLRSQELVPFVDLQIATALAHLRENNPERVLIRFPRDLRLDDLKSANAVIIGSVGSNPWAAIAEANANFRIVDRPGMEGAEIINRNPQPGEAASYLSHWNEPAHETFALIAFLPNLSGNGHLLVLEGLDVAGTQAAAEMLLHPSAIDPILRRATRPDGSLRHFEVLLRSTSIESNATGTQVIASRFY
ncbi:MAG TPA: hypothetical protein VMD55_10390 [Terracidiphilus sp.]|nr:hypothetical protein [Terracidiphilus sp.]